MLKKHIYKSISNTKELRELIGKEQKISERSVTQQVTRRSERLESYRVIKIIANYTGIKESDLFQ